MATQEERDRVGALIREARELRGLTQSELAAIVGSHKDSIGNWERGEHYPDGKMPKLESALEISLRKEVDAALPAHPASLEAILESLRKAERHLDDARATARELIDGTTPA